MDFSFSKKQKKRKIIGGGEQLAAPRAPPEPSAEAEAEPAPQRPKVDKAVVQPPQSRRKSRAKAADLAPEPAAAPATPAAPLLPAREPAAETAPASAKTSASARAEASSAADEQVAAPAEGRPSAATQSAELAVRNLELVLERVMKARADQPSGPASALPDVVCRFMQLVKERPPAALSSLAGAAEALSKAAVVESLEGESVLWEAALRSSLAVAYTPAPPTADAEPALAPLAPTADLAPELSAMAVRASFRLEAAEARLRWARAAAEEARRTHLKAAEFAHAKAFGGYEQVDDPQALLRAVAA